VKYAIRLQYIQLLTVGLALTVGQSQFKEYTGLKGEDRVMQYCGATMLGLSSILMAVAQLGEGCMRKALQYGMIPSAMNVVIAFVAEDIIDNLRYAIAGGNVLNVAVAIYVCYVLPGKKQTKRPAAGLMTNFTRFTYLMYFGLGLAAAVKSWDKKNIDGFGWASALLDTSFILMAVAQCGEAACRKVTQYGMVTAMLFGALHTYECMYEATEKTDMSPFYGDYISWYHVPLGSTCHAVLACVFLYVLSKK
jgi:hypothetical protein